MGLSGRPSVGHQCWRQHEPSVWFYSVGTPPSSRYSARRPSLGHRGSTSESCPVLTVPTPPPGNEPEAFSSLALFLPAAMAALCVAKPFPVSATTLFESRISKNHAMDFLPHSFSG